MPKLSQELTDEQLESICTAAEDACRDTINKKLRELGFPDVSDDDFYTISEAINDLYC